MRSAAGAEQKNMERTLQAVEHSEETTFWGEVKVTRRRVPNCVSSSNPQNARSKITCSRMTVVPSIIPLMRKFNQADRDRDRLVVEFDFMPTDSAWHQPQLSSAPGRITPSPMIGLQESEEKSYTLNLNLAVGKRAISTPFVTRDNIDSRMLNATAHNADPWDARTADEITTMGLGFSTRIDDKSSIGIDYVSSDSTGGIAWFRQAMRKRPSANCKRT